MGYDIAKAAQADTQRREAAKAEQMQRAAGAIQQFFDEVESGKRPVRDLENLAEVARGRSRGRFNDDGNGNTGDTPERRAFETLLSSTQIPGGVKQAFRRLLNPEDSDYIKVEADGTPTVVKGLKTNVERLEAENERLRNELTEVQNPRHPGSLANRLAAAEAATRVDATRVNEHLNAASKAVDKVKAANRYSTDVVGTDAVKTAINNAKTALVPPASAPATTPAPATP
jgi:HAMP domain-containing protein